MGAFLVSFIEELVYRGVPLHDLRARMSPLPAVFVAVMVYEKLVHRRLTGAAPMTGN